MNSEMLKFTKVIKDHSGCAEVKAEVDWEKLRNSEAVSVAHTCEAFINLDLDKLIQPVESKEREKLQSLIQKYQVGYWRLKYGVSDSMKKMIAGNGRVTRRI
jgi:hypothetical protein